MTSRAAQFHALYKELRIADQRNYYRQRRLEYEQANRQAIVVRNTLLVLAALAGIAGQLVTGTDRALCGVIAALLAALAAAVTGFEGLIGFAQLRKLYNDAELNLDEAEIGWDAAGSDGDLAAELERVEQIFRTENGQWGQLVIEAAPKSAPNGSEGR
jgi:SMODS and SLOG-associating 2TM effector domain 1